MKKIIFNIILILIISIFSTSCGTEIKDYNITILINTNLSESSDEPLPSIIKDFLGPKEDTDNKLVFIPKLFVLRNDLNEENKMEIEIPISMENKLRKKMGTYTYVDLKLDYDEFLPKMTAGDFLSKKGNTTNNKNNLKINSKDLVFIIGESNLTAPNYFSNVKSLKIKLDSILISEGKSFSKNVIIKYETEENTIIGGGDTGTGGYTGGGEPIDPEVTPCNQQTTSKAVSLKEDLLQVINIQNSYKERDKLARIIWEKYFDEMATITKYHSSNQKHPDYWESGDGANYFIDRLAYKNSIIDINIPRLEFHNKTGKITSMEIVECHNASQIQ